MAAATIDAPDVDQGWIGGDRQRLLGRLSGSVTGRMAPPRLDLDAVWDADRVAPALLEPGTEVKFVAT